jgi:L-asparaginase/Glu-tRNA(Gln) amidotransferase subunit D
MWERLTERARSVVLSAHEEARRLGEGYVGTRGGRVEIDANARELGVLSGEDLDGLKARMLLVAALGETRDPRRLQSFFEALSGVSPS